MTSPPNVALPGPGQEWHAGPGGPPPVPARSGRSRSARSRSRRWLWWRLAAAVAVLGLCPAGVLAVWIGPSLVRAQLAAQAPAPSPGAALLRYMYSFGWPDDQSGLDRLVMAQRRTELLNQRKGYLRQMHGTATVTGHRPGRFELCAGPAGDTRDRPQISGDTGTDALWVCVRWISPNPPTDPGSSPGASPGAGSGAGSGARSVLGEVRGVSRLWTGQARRDDGGWRLWSVSIPPWCSSRTGDGYARCL